jgi:prevent-host-death family protein
MTISVTELKARCLEIIRDVERERKVVEIVRRGEVVARLLPANAPARANAKPWERLAVRDSSSIRRSSPCSSSGISSLSTDLAARHTQHPSFAAGSVVEASASFLNLGRHISAGSQCIRNPKLATVLQSSCFRLPPYLRMPNTTRSSSLSASRTKSATRRAIPAACRSYCARSTS